MRCNDKKTEHSDLFEIGKTFYTWSFESTKVVILVMSGKRNIYMCMYYKDVANVP